MYDEDIKIAGDRPSATIKTKPLKSTESGYAKELSNGNIDRAKALGKIVAEKFFEAGNDIMPETEPGENVNMAIQRQQLLAFAVRIGLEEFCPNETVADSAVGAFEKTLQKIDPSMFAVVSDNGALSFYYLAYRRGGDVERRVGQTFAMLCSHDGDPIYQELGEALYCWFLSFVKDKCEKAGFEE